MSPIIPVYSAYDKKVIEACTDFLVVMRHIHAKRQNSQVIEHLESICYKIGVFEGIAGFSNPTIVEGLLKTAIDEFDKYLSTELTDKDDIGNEMVRTLARYLRRVIYGECPKAIQQEVFDTLSDRD